MIKLLVCASLLIAFVGADYDFQDSDFNQLLFDDLQASVDDEVSEPLRLKRGAGNDTEPKDCHRKKGKKEKESHCCNGVRANSQELEAVKEVKKNCIAEVRGEAADTDGYDPLNCEGVQTMRQQMVCAAECMAKKLDLLAENGEFKRDDLLNHTRRVAGESQAKSADIEGYVDKCLGELKSSKEVQRSDGSGKAECNPNPLEFHHCIWKEFVQGCPAEAQSDSKKCRKIRERLAKGDTSYADKSFKKHLRSHHKGGRDRE